MHCTWNLGAFFVVKKMSNNSQAISGSRFTRQKNITLCVLPFFRLENYIYKSHCLCVKFQCISMQSRIYEKSEFPVCEIAKTQWDKIVLSQCFVHIDNIKF